MITATGQRVIMKLRRLVHHCELDVMGRGRPLETIVGDEDAAFDIGGILALLCCLFASSV